MKQRDEYIVDCKIHNPRPVNLICDATFYGKRKDKLGTLVFKDNESKEILIWKHIESELVKDYKYLKDELLDRGYTPFKVLLSMAREAYIRPLRIFQYKCVTSIRKRLYRDISL